VRNAGPLPAVSERWCRLRARMVTKRASTLSFLVEEVELDLLAPFALLAGSEHHDEGARNVRPGPCPAVNSVRLRRFFLTTRQPSLDRSWMNDDTEALCDATDQIC